MHEYDNIDYRYKSSDGKIEDEAIEFVAGVLGSLPDIGALEYDLNFFSGGIGVYDKLAFSYPIPSEGFEIAAKKLRLASPAEAINDPAWSEDFAWLVEHEGDANSIRRSAADFIDKNRKPFQSLCTEELAIFFARESDVNTWTAVWVSEGKFNYLHFEQG